MTRRKEIHELARKGAAIARSIQADVDVILAPATAPAQTRRSPRQLEGKRVVKIRITAESEAEADEARALVEQLLAAHQARLQSPREGSNPRYADQQKWMSYGDFVLPQKRRK